VVDPAVIPDDFDQFGFGVALSPDGSAATWLRSGPTRQDRVILDFDAGEVAAAPSETWTNGSTWAADNSGVFDIAGGELHFIDRATGESVAFGRELGPLLTLGVRRPDAELPEPPLIVSAAVTPSEPIGATGLVLSAAPNNGGVGVLSIDSGELATWQSAPVGRGTAVLAPSADGVLVLPADGSPPFRTTPGSETTLPPDVAAAGPLLVGPTDDTVWVPDADAPRDTVRYRLLRLDGTVADDLGSATVDAPDATLLGGDGRGALVVLRRGDVFVVGVDGAARLTTGELIAIGPTTAYVRECESLDGCVVVRVERVTQQRTPVSSGSGVLDGLTGVDGSRVDLRRRTRHRSIGRVERRVHLRCRPRRAGDQRVRPRGSSNRRVGHRPSQGHRPRPSAALSIGRPHDVAVQSSASFESSENVSTRAAHVSSGLSPKVSTSPSHSNVYVTGLLPGALASQ
jgi:hypothetical protein